MDGFPPISAMCLTYGRPQVLEEAIQSFLLQDYPGPKELVVLNDCAEQSLICSHSEVRIINVTARFRTVGEKRNACAALARHDILFVWDDDDIYLPWRLSLSIRKFDLDRGYYKPTRAWMLRNHRLDGPEANLFHSSACFTRDLFNRTRGYPHCGSGQDWGIEVDFARMMGGRKDDRTLSDQELFYVYRWEGTGSYHLSAFGRDEGQSITGNTQVADFVEEEMRRGAVPRGEVLLHPTWRRDYLALVRQRLGDSNALSASESASTTIHDFASPFIGQESSSMSLPLVSCIMPTYGRPDFVAESLAMFLAQDYPAKELIILNDCPGQTLEGDFPNVRIINAPERWPNLGEKRNAAIESAKGEYIAIWDDDDVYFPWRLSLAMQRLQAIQTPIYCPADYWAYWGDTELHENSAQLDWIYHPLVVFRRELWSTIGGYPQQTVGEDTVFFQKALQHLGIEWPRDAIARSDRPMIMRGRSKYAHTSIDGGAQPPDTTPGVIALAPRPIQDPILRNVADSLIHFREAEAKRHKLALQMLQAECGDIPRSRRVYMETLDPQTASVGCGVLGRHGELGYEGKRVRVCGQPFSHALSTHGPARLVYQLEGRFQRLICHVAMNDDVPPEAASADFWVRADGRMVAIARNVRPHQVPRLLVADLRGAREVELIVQHRPWEYCHAVWLDPFLVSEEPVSPPRLISTLERAEILAPAPLPRAELCIATVGSPGFEDWLDDFLGSVCANAQCPEALLVIFFFGDSERIQQVARKYGAHIILCNGLRPLSAACKSVLYSAGRVIDAEKFICLDADMLVLDDLRPIVAAIDATPPGSILACREAGFHRDLEQALDRVYAGKPSEVTAFLGADATPTLRSSLVVNDGIFAGSRVALCGLDQFLRGLDRPADWVDDPEANIYWRNQFIFNLALAHLGIGVELDSRYNVQINFEAIQFRDDNGLLAADSDNRHVAIAHFNGAGKHKEIAWRGRFRTVEQPLVSCQESPSLQQFLDALRRWIGKYGTRAMAWSFYGTADARSAHIAHPSSFLLLTTLHHLIRSNGCHRVIETGTARGVSAACLASAVAHRQDAQVVTLDNHAFPEREILWNALPDETRRAIVPRQTDILAGLQIAVEEGETYQAALLDSQHTAEHVLKEFALVTQLVCPGGLILIHDAILPLGTVGSALNEIAKQGYGVTKLWTADEGVREDSGLGLALIENRRRPN